MDKYMKCFFPLCRNDSNNSSKTIVRIREDLRERWCREANVAYYQCYTQYCCEDHFDATEALTNFNFKAEKKQPRFKPTAKLRNLGATLLEEETSLELLPLQSPSELYKILTEPQPNTPKKRKYETSVTTATMSDDLLQIPFKVSVHTQCSAKMVDKATQYQARKVQFTTPAPPKPSTGTSS